MAESILHINWRLRIGYSIVYHTGVREGAGMGETNQGRDGTQFPTNARVVMYHHIHFRLGCCCVPSIVVVIPDMHMLS